MPSARTPAASTAPRTTPPCAKAAPSWSRRPIDLFGDGTVVIHAAPGHTPGHQILLLTMPGGEQPLLLVGDAFYAPEDRKHRRVPEWNIDKAASFRSIDRIEQLAEETGARLLVHHDPNA